MIDDEDDLQLILLLIVILTIIILIFLAYRFIINNNNNNRRLNGKYYTQLLKLNENDSIENQNELQKDINEFTTIIYNYEPSRCPIYHYIFTNYNDFVNILKNNIVLKQVKIPLTEFLVVMYKLNIHIKFEEIIGCGTYNCIIKMKLNDKSRILRLTYDSSEYRFDNYNQLQINQRFLKTLTYNENPYFPKIYYSSLKFISRNNQDYQTYIPSLWYVEKIYQRIDFSMIKNKLNEYINSIKHIIKYFKKYNFKYCDWKIDNLLYSSKYNLFVLIDFDISSNSSYSLENIRLNLKNIKIKDEMSMLACIDITNIKISNSEDEYYYNMTNNFDNRKLTIDDEIMNCE
jgi:hypothetical protein